MKRFACWAAFCAVFTTVFCSAEPLWAVSPNPLQSAYWRFEEGTPGNAVAPEQDIVLDSINNNHLRADHADSAPTYTSATAPFYLRSHRTNNAAMSFSNAPPSDYLVTSGRDINNGIIPPGGGFTIEAAFRPNTVNFPSQTYQAIIAKAGRPEDGPLPTLVLKVRGDNGNLQFEQFDQSGTLRQVQSLAPLSGNQWYAAAVVNDGSQMSLYLRTEFDADYVLQGSTLVSGAVYQGSDDWDKAWSVGRGVYGGTGDGAPADWFNGILDEVRLSNTALPASKFLFAEAGIDGDYNDDGVVDAADFVLWSKHRGTNASIMTPPPTMSVRMITRCGRRTSAPAAARHWPRPRSRSRRAACGV